jgi:transposase
MQCADRFHVVKNLTEAAQLLLARCHAEIMQACQADAPPSDSSKSVIAIEEWRPKELASVQKARLARRAGRYARYQRMVELHEQGRTRQEIARLVGLSDRTVQQWLTAGTFPEARKRRKKHSDFEAFAPAVLKRWNEGERNGIRLARELRAQGYIGSERTVYRYLEVLKQAEVRSFRPPPPSGCLCETQAGWMRWSEKRWQPFARPVQRFPVPMISSKNSC